MSAGKCKRGPEVLLCATSSSDDDSPRSADTSATTTTEPASPSLPTHHCDVSSPASSNGAADPSVVRLPGFTQQMPRRPRLKKKKPDLNVGTGDVLCSRETSHSEHTVGPLASSRLAKHQLTPRNKPPRGTQFLPYFLYQHFRTAYSLIFMSEYVHLHDILKILHINAHTHTQTQTHTDRERERCMHLHHITSSVTCV